MRDKNSERAHMCSFNKLVPSTCDLSRRTILSGEGYPVNCSNFFEGFGEANFLGVSVLFTTSDHSFDLISSVAAGQFVL